MNAKWVNYVMAGLLLTGIYLAAWQGAKYLDMRVQTTAELIPHEDNGTIPMTEEESADTGTTDADRKVVVDAGHGEHKLRQQI